MSATIVVPSLQTAIHHGSEYEKTEHEYFIILWKPQEQSGTSSILLLFIFDFPRDFITYWQSHSQTLIIIQLF